MKILKYVNPVLVFKSLKGAIIELKHFNTYIKIISELEDNGTLEQYKIVKDKSYLLIGIDLNPELLIYADDKALESAELKMVSEKMKKYSNFLQEQGVLDSVKADYERIKSDDYYGYLINISFIFRKYKKRKFIYDICYHATIILAVLSLIGYML